MAGLWYYSDKREQKGPVSLEELRGLAQSGTIRPTDLVWQEGTKDWLRASLVDGLFDVSSGAAPDAEAWDEPGPRSRRRDEPGRGESRGGQRDYNRDADRPRRRQSTRREEGMSSGLKIGLIVGGVALLLIVVAVILILVLRGGGSGGSNNYTITLMAGQTNQRNFTIKAGRPVDVRVSSTLLDGFHADVDCEVYEPGNMVPIGVDFFPGKDCNVRFNARRSGSYRVVVRNQGPGRASAQVDVRY